MGGGKRPRDVRSRGELFPLGESVWGSTGVDPTGPSVCVSAAAAHFESGTGSYAAPRPSPAMRRELLQPHADVPQLILP